MKLIINHLVGLCAAIFLLHVLTPLKAATTTVPAGAALQPYLDLAQPGDTLVLAAGAVYKGNFLLRMKTGTAYITITSSQISQLPPGTRVNPSQAHLMPKLIAPNGSAALQTDPGAHHYQIVGLELASEPGDYSYGVLRLGPGGETSLNQLPHDILVDRVYVHGDPNAGGKRGIALNGIRTTVQNSWISEFKSSWQEAQGIAGWNGPGPFTITNNRIEAASQGVAFFDNATIAGVTPSDITINRNYITKPLSWRGGPWIVKNLIEFKAGKRILIDSNIIENVWLAQQNGTAIVLKAGGSGVANIPVTDGVTITNNIIRHAAAPIRIHGTNGQGGYARNLTVRQNLFDDIGKAWGSGLSVFLLITPGTQNVIYENNTATPTVTTTSLVSTDTSPTTGFVFRSNIVPHGFYGIKGSGYVTGISTINHYFPNSSISNNILYGVDVDPTSYPPLNYIVPVVTGIGWQSLTVYRLGPISLYNNKGANGKDPGVDYDALMFATAKVISGLP